MKKKPKDSYRRIFKDDVLQTYLDQIKVFPLLNFDEELVLSRQIQQGNNETLHKEALHKLINANLRLVVKIARFYATHDTSFMDLIQEGNLGLIHAAEKYDHSKKVRFCTYATWWIRQFISRYLTNKRRIVRLPHRKEEMLRRIQRTYHTLSQTLMHQPRNEDIACELGMPVRDVDYILNMSSGALPLETGEDDTNAVVELYEDYTYSPERNLFRQSSRDNVLRIFDQLKSREKQVLTYRYELDGGDHCTLKEIGDKMDLSPETVRQIEMKALKKIRCQAEEIKKLVFLEAI